MNLELLNPFENDFPEIIEECLEDGFATTCAFNRKGTLLAVGTSQGCCVIWDFDTKGVARSLHGHARAITSISWSKDGRRLLTSSADWKIMLWDIVTSNKVFSLDLGTIVMSAQLSYREGNYWCVACPYLSPPVLINLDKPQEKFDLTISEDPDAAAPSDAKGSKGGDRSAIAVFNRFGDQVYIGNYKGFVYIVSTVTRQLITSFRVPGGAAIKSISFDKNFKFLLINSADRVVRIFDAETNTCMREFQDYVNKMQWKKCCFSGNTDYVIGGSAQKQEHNIYIWNTYGQLVKILEGPKEGIMDLVWHPSRPVIASCSTSGVVYIWAKNYTENWSAFAPDFKELEENEEYEEREDEFDVVPENDKLKKKQDDEDERVDIMEVERDPDADEDDSFLLSLPTRPERDVR